MLELSTHVLDAILGHLNKKYRTVLAPRILSPGWEDKPQLESGQIIILGVM